MRRATPVASNSRILPASRPTHVNMRIERDLRSPQRLIHVDAPGFALKAAVQRRGRGQRLRRAAEQFEIVAFGDRFQQRDPLPVVRRDGAGKGNFDIHGRLRRQRIEQGRLECQMIDFGANAKASKIIHRRGQLRHHQIVDRPVLAARRRNPDLPDQERLADALDTPHQGRVDVKRILVEHQVGLKILDLRQQDCFGLGIEFRAEADLAGQRPQHRLERGHGALQPRWKRLALGCRGRCRGFDWHPVFAPPGRLKPGIVDMDLRRSMAERCKIP